ncbi:MAG: CinA family protein [Rhodobiaceae bacterium]|nr:CinA family protein [Rhodobiaceae bacterium]MCC0052765.1 CinA family protein [Rhodobiaceae bacterium]
MPSRHEPLARALILACRSRHLMVATAESCTGGKIASALTEITGSSDVFERGFVTYSNRAKVEMLDVAEELIDEHGAVSEEVAREMALGARNRSRAELAVSVTGIAGPAGGSDEKPVGTVHFVCCGPGSRLVHVEKRYGPKSRAEIRDASTEQALKMLLEAAKSAAKPEAD